MAVAVLFAVAWLACDERLRSLLTTSLVVSFFAAVLAVGLGTFLAIVFLRTNLPGRSLGPWLLAGLLFLPLYVHIAGWETVLGKFGWWTTWTGQLESPVLSGMFATIWIHAVAGIPWAALFAAAGLNTVDPAWEEAVLCDLPWTGVLRRITVPAIAPFLLLAMLWIATITAGEMTVTNIYQVRTYAEEIYTNFSQQASLTDVVASSLPGFLVLAAIAGALFLLLPHLVPATTLGQMRPAIVWPLGRCRWLVAISTWSLLGLIILVPLASLMHQAGGQVVETEQGLERSWSAQKMTTLVARVLPDNLPEFQSTLAIAVLAGAVTVVLVLLPAWWGGISGRTIVPWGFLLPALIPGPLVGIAVIVLLNRPEDPTGLLTWLYDDTLAPPVLAVLPRTIPIAGLILWSAFRQTPRDLRDRALLETGSRWRQAWLLIGGLHRRAILAAALAALAVAAGDLACSILVLPPGVQTVPFRVFQLLHSGCDDRMAALCLVQFFLTAGIGGSVAGLLRWK